MVVFGLILGIYAPKGQLISKANCQTVNSSKKRRNEFVFTTMWRVFVCLKKLKTPKRHFEIIWPLDNNPQRVNQRLLSSYLEPC